MVVITSQLYQSPFCYTALALSVHRFSANMHSSSPSTVSFLLTTLQTSSTYHGADCSLTRHMTRRWTQALYLKFVSLDPSVLLTASIPDDQALARDRLSNFSTTLVNVQEGGTTHDPSTRNAMAAFV